MGCLAETGDVYDCWLRAVQARVQSSIHIIGDPSCRLWYLQSAVLHLPELSFDLPDKKDRRILKKVPLTISLKVPLRPPFSTFFSAFSEVWA